MWRMSAPPLSRCVATEWRKVWHVTVRLMPAFFAHVWTMSFAVEAWRSPPRGARKSSAERRAPRSFGRASRREASMAEETKATSQHTEPYGEDTFYEGGVIVSPRT